MIKNTKYPRHTLPTVPKSAIQNLYTLFIYPPIRIATPPSRAAVSVSFICRYLILSQYNSNKKGHFCIFIFSYDFSLFGILCNSKPFAFIRVFFSIFLKVLLAIMYKMT